MTACRDCKYFIPDSPEGPTCKWQPTAYDIKVRPKAGPEHRPYCRNCVSAIINEELPKMRGEILEIGPGVIKTTRNVLRKNIEAGLCKWSGIDPMWRKPILPGAHRGTVGALPFEDSSFDHVIAFETMEHWEEYGERLDQGLFQIHRVLKRGGHYLATVPIHGHGHEMFVRGDLYGISDLFHDRLWTKVWLTPWRKDFSPCKPSLSWLTWNEGKFANEVRKHSDMDEPSTWCLEIQAWKRGA